MKTKKLFSLVLLGLLCSIGNVWGDTVTFSGDDLDKDAATKTKGQVTVVSATDTKSLQQWKDGNTKKNAQGLNFGSSADTAVVIPTSEKAIQFKVAAGYRITGISILGAFGSDSNSGDVAVVCWTGDINYSPALITSLNVPSRSAASAPDEVSVSSVPNNTKAFGLYRRIKVDNANSPTIIKTSSGSNYPSSSGAWYLFSVKVTYEAIPTYTVTYNGNGKTSGSVPEDEDSPYYSGSTVTVLGNTGSLAKTGYAFMGWNSKDDGTGADFTPDGTFTITKDTVLYAKWAATYTVTYHANGSGEEDMVKNNATTIIANPFTYANHTFTGWNTQADGKGTSHEVGSSVSGNLELYAQWQASHALSVTVNDGDMGNAEAEETTVIEGQTTGITATPEPGYRFVNWTIVSGTGASIDNVNDVSATFTMGTTDASIRANFEAKTYTVTLNNQSATTAGTANVTTTYNASTNLTSSITCPEKTDYVFCGYYTATNGGGLRLIDNNGAWLASVTGYTDADKNWIKDGNVTLYAYWMKYATSIDMEQFVIDNKKSGDYQAYLDAHNFKYTNDKKNITLDSLDSNKPTQAYNYTYLGLKIKKDAAFVAALVPAGKIVTIKLGNMTADGKLFKDGVEYKTDLKGVANTSEKPAVYYFYSEEAAVYRFQTTSSDAAVLKQFLIEDTYSCAVTSGNWGTICLPYAMPASGRSGATFYSIVGKTASSVLLEEVTGDLAAGTPYIYQANASSIVSNFTGNMQYAVQSASGLVGNMSSTPASVGDNKYIIYNNQVCKVNGATVTCPQYKAYIDLSGVSSLAPSRFIEIPLAPENATNIEDLEASDSVVKFIHNGQLLIKRDGITYDALGRIVK